jgi:phage protein D
MKITLKATSIPYTSTMRKQLKTRAWEKISLKGIATQMGKDNGLKVLYLADDNPVYKRKEQVRKSDIKFLQKLCKAAGMALKVTTKTIVIFDTAEYESKPHIKTIKYGDSDIISFKFGTSLTDTAYTKCHVSYTNPDTKQTIEYTYTPSSTEGTGQTLEINEKVSSTEEAKKLAKKRLREKNAQEFTASFTMVGNVSLVAGATIKVKGFQEFDRKYIITKATHKLIGGYTTDIDLKQVLEGY